MKGRRRMKKILTKLLLIVLVISLPVACSNVENAGQDTDKANETVTEEDSTAKEEEGALEVPDTEEPQNELSFYERISKLYPETNLPEASASNLPRWRGFNLMEKFNATDFSRNAPFRENDFKWIAELGFNFVRLPMDYRCWILDGDWNKINEKELLEIDQAVEWGRKYGIHVQINFHRGPGYCVNPPAEPKSLWTDEEAQEAFIKHWVMFAERYKGVPSKDLSFNLLNEPAGVDDETYAKIVKKTVEAIHKVDPDRLIVIDGNSWAKKPVFAAKDLNVAQSLHNYEPFNVTHYKASWINGSDTWPEPQWPVPYLPDKLYGLYKPDLNVPFVIEGDFKEESTVSIRVQVVSNFARLVIKADGKEVFNQMIRSGPGEGDWKEVVYAEEWDIYQNIFDRDYTATIPANTKKIELEVRDGDWLSFSKVEIKPISGSGESIVILPTMMDWGVKPGTIQIDENGKILFDEEKTYLNKAWLKREFIDPFLELKNQGVGVMVGEWGVYDKTPHDVALRWMEDSLEVFEEAGIGWALWEFRGSFGILDNNRPGAEYVDFYGHKLDKKMLELLQKH